MSILGGISSNMATPSFGELKKQASFFLKEKIKTARLALTDVTPAQLLAEEVTCGNQWGPDTQTMRLIAKAAFEVDDYWRIVDILHKRLSKFDKQNWRVSYNSLILLEHLLTHGPESAAQEFQLDKDVISEMESFQFTDDKGLNWGLAVRKKSERVLSLLENRTLLKQERDRSRKLTRGIHGFGSFGDHTHTHTPDHGVLKQSSSFGCNHDIVKNSLSTKDDCQEDTYSFDSLGQVQYNETCHKGNTVPSNLDLTTKLKHLNCTGEAKPLIGKSDSGISPNEDHHHPFTFADAQASVSLLTTKY